MARRNTERMGERGEVLRVGWKGIDLVRGSFLDDVLARALGGRKLWGKECKRPRATSRGASQRGFVKKKVLDCRQRSSANSRPSGCGVAKMGVGKLAGFLSSRVEQLKQRKHQITRPGWEGRENIGIGSYARPGGRNDQRKQKEKDGESREDDQRSEKRDSYQIDRSNCGLRAVFFGGVGWAGKEGGKGGKREVVVPGTGTVGMAGYSWV
jgi:hypothetical protein